MIKNEARAEINDMTNSEKGITFEVNFDEDNKDCIRISFDGGFRVIKYDDLFAFMFTIATKEQQAKMIPVREELGHQYMKQIQVKLKKDMKEGEMMVVNVPINVPELIEEQIKYELSQKDLSPYVKDLQDEK